MFRTICITFPEINEASCVIKMMRYPVQKQVILIYSYEGAQPYAAARMFVYKFSLKQQENKSRNRRLRKKADQLWSELLGSFNHTPLRY